MFTENPDIQNDDVLFDENDGSGRILFERFLTYRRRMARLSSVQALYLYEMLQMIKEEESIGAGESLFDDNKDNRINIDSLFYNVVYFYKNLFFGKEEYGFTKKTRKIDESYFKEIVYTVIKQLQEIDKIISDHLNEKWTMARLDLVVKSVLRCAIGEILNNTKTDCPILTSEYTNIASQFFNGREIGFINGIIDKVAKEIRSDGRT